MNRSTRSSLSALRPLLLLLVASVLIVALLPSGGLLAAARHVFQSPGAPEADSPLPTPTPVPPTPTPLPPTATSLPPTSTPQPPTATPEGEPPTATAEPVPPTAEVPAGTPPPEEPAVPVEATQPAAEHSPTPETVHLPAVEAGSEQQQPAQGQAEAGGQPAPAESEQLPEAPPESPAAEQSDQNSTARFIDGLVVLFSYGWLACGALLLLAIPVAVFLLPRWGRRRDRA